MKFEALADPIDTVASAGNQMHLYFGEGGQSLQRARSQVES